MLEVVISVLKDIFMSAVIPKRFRNKRKEKENMDRIMDEILKDIPDMYWEFHEKH